MIGEYSIPGYKYDLKRELSDEVYEKRGYVELQKDCLQREERDYIALIEKVREYLKTIKSSDGKNGLEIFERSARDEYIYLKRYILYRAQIKNFKFPGYFDCDSSYPVKLFYRQPPFNYQAKYEYFDSYFSMQTFWGSFTRQFYQSGSELKDFLWQFEHFDDVILKNASREVRKLLAAFDNLAHFYHTIGNLAPCPPSINSPKGKANGCYDRIDLFLKDNLMEKWLGWYYQIGSEKVLLAKKSKHVATFVLESFLNPELPEVPPLNTELMKTENIEKLTVYLNAVTDLIRERGKKIVRKARSKNNL